MIISHRHRFIFIKLRKTAGTSMEIALSGICGDQDVITPISEEDEKVRREQGFRGPQNTLIPFRYYRQEDWKNLIAGRKRKRFYNHMTAGEIKACLPGDVWNGYFKFCFERNPWDKVISHYFHRNRNEKFRDIMDYLRHDHGDDLHGSKAYMIDGKVAVDRIFRYEDMEGALTELTDLLALDKKLQLPSYRAKSQFRKDHRSYREILSEEEAAIISGRFRDDIALLGYRY